MQSHLAQLPFFRTLPDAALSALAETAEMRHFAKGERLFEEGQPAEAAWLIQKGWVYLEKRSPQGTPVTIFTVTPEDVLCGFSAVIGHNTYYYAAAVAATDTTAFRVSHAHFARLLREQSGVFEQVLAIYHTRMRHLAEAISMAQAPVEQRLAYVLLRLRATFGKTIPITHRELSHMAGTRWETSIRTLSIMKRKGWIASSRGKMAVVQPQQLRALLTPRT